MFRPEGNRIHALHIGLPRYRPRFAPYLIIPLGPRLPDSPLDIFTNMFCRLRHSVPIFQLVSLYMLMILRDSSKLITVPKDCS